MGAKKPAMNGWETKDMSTLFGIDFRGAGYRITGIGIPTIGATGLLKAWMEFRRVQNESDFLDPKNRPQGPSIV